MAFPPEFHSVSLNSGPGPGSLLAAAAAWNALSAAYSEALDDLSALVAGVQAGVWEGPGAESFASANAQYLAWLAQAAVDAVATAAQHETAASAFTTALFCMPTPGELAANHVTHAALLATNFFGVNTIPITLNEADYARMWVQAAAVMSTYQAVSTATVAAVPAASPAPVIVKSGNPAAASASPDDLANLWENFVRSVVNQLFGFQSPPELDSLDTFFPAVQQFLRSPSPELLGALVVAATYEVTFDTLFAAPAALLGTPLLSFGGLAGLAGLREFAVIAEPGPLPTDDGRIPESTATQARPAAGIAPMVATPGPATSAGLGPSTPTPAPAAAPVPASTSSVAGFGYLVSSRGPDDRDGPTLIDRGKDLPLPTTVAAVAAASAGESARRRLRRRESTVMRGRGREYMDLDSELSAPPDREPAAPAASNHGAGPLGFTGTISGAAEISPDGLIALADGLDGESVTPLLPRTWGSDR